MREAAFDSIAAEYDREFTHTLLARVLRERVWSRLSANFKAGDHILELNCGTGEDAAWLAQHGMTVVATDVSTAMLEVAQQKAQRVGVSHWIEIRWLDLTGAQMGLEAFTGSAWVAKPTKASSPDRGSFDGVLSNFGGLNCVRNLRPLTTMLSEIVNPGGRLILVPMNRWCVWEIVWHLIHLRPRTAFRRLRQNGIDANIGSGKVHVWYPSIRSLRQVFGPTFKLRRVIGLGVFLPPSYLESVVAKRPRLFNLLTRLERATAARFPFNRLADHVILEFEHR